MDNQYQSTYTPNTPKIKKEMLSDIGVDSYKDLFSDIPEKYRFPDLNLPSPTSELDLKNELSKIANKNSIPGEYSSFLGLHILHTNQKFLRVLYKHILNFRVWYVN